MLAAAMWGQADRADHAGLPNFVRRELAGFLDCAILARGFARVRCTRCGDDLLVAFSCKGRGICPSCGGRRMADTAAHLVDRVLPRVSVRQWVLSLPFSLRFGVAFDRELCSRVRSLVMAAVLDALRRRAREQQGVGDGRSGAVVFVQRFGGALNLNVHFHALVLDGVFHERADGGAPVFRAGLTLGHGDLADVLLTIRVKIEALLRGRGLLADDGAAAQELVERSPVLAQAQAASVQGRLAFGPQRGQGVTRVGSQRGTPFVQEPREDCAVEAGYSLHAGPPVPGNDRDRVLYTNSAERVRRALPWCNGDPGPRDCEKCAVVRGRCGQSGVCQSSGSRRGSPGTRSSMTSLTISSNHSSNISRVRCSGHWVSSVTQHSSISSKRSGQACSRIALRPVSPSHEGTRKVFGSFLMDSKTGSASPSPSLHWVHAKYGARGRTMTAERFTIAMVTQPGGSA